MTTSDPPGVRVPVDAEVAKRLSGLVASLRTRYGDSVVTKESIGVKLEITRIVPPDAGACDASWIEMGASELILAVGNAGGWEMNRDLDAVKKIENSIDAVVEGRVVRLFGLRRLSVIVNLNVPRRLRYTPWEISKSP